jgi:hypothetical protein
VFNDKLDRNINYKSYKNYKDVLNSDSEGDSVKATTYRIKQEYLDESINNQTLR